MGGSVQLIEDLPDGVWETLFVPARNTFL